MIKAYFYLDGVAIKSVKFENDADMQPLDNKTIYDASPDKWDVCKWDHGEVTPMRKKRKTKSEDTATDVEIQSDLTDSDSE